MTKISRSTLLLLMGFFCSYPAFCAEPAAIKQCYDQASTTLGMRQCADREYKYYDGILNKTYQDLSALLATEDQPTLVAAQKAWLIFRDKECNFMSLQNEGGTLQPLNRVGCYNTMNKKRIEELQAYIEYYNS